jgi:ankyrin repeat protein
MNVIDKHGRLPLHYASKNGCGVLVEFFLKRSKSDVNLIDENGKSYARHRSLVTNNRACALTRGSPPNLAQASRVCRIGFPLAGGGAAHGQESRLQCHHQES